MYLGRSKVWLKKIVYLVFVLLDVRVSIVITKYDFNTYLLLLWVKIYQRKFLEIMNLAFTGNTKD